MQNIHIIGKNIANSYASIIYPVAAIQVVQVVRCTRAHDQITIFLKLISSVSHVASHSGYYREIVF